MGKIFKWLIIISATLNFGFMAVDGTRAFMVGDYFRPSSGEYAGQLGPWSQVVEAAGINPEGVAMKVIFVVWGMVGLGLTIGFVGELPIAAQGLLILSILSLWYLVPGTILSLIQIVLLWLYRRKTGN